jgi:glyoxylase-like metal-dependent hydrolase (beta-lactamase superfamily II)
VARTIGASVLGQAGEEHGVTRPVRLRDGLSLLDLNFQDQPGVIAAYLIESGGEYALVEAGPSSTLDALLEGVRQAGIAPEAVSKLIVTHIHLDHAGAAGTLVRRYPHLQVYVHEVGAPHLIDPSKLLSSASRIYGDRMDQLWGEVLAVPATNIHALSDGDRVIIGTSELVTLYTPGHASHHVAYLDAEHEEVFTGDVAAIRLQGFDYIRPATPPPDVDLELWSTSLKRLQDINPRSLHLTHFGSFSDVERHLTAAREQLYAWAAFIEDLRDRDYEPEAMKLALKERAEGEVLRAHNDPEALRQYELAAPSGMSVDGYLRYFRKRSAASG